MDSRPLHMKNYRLWYKRLDEACWNRLGVSVSDLPDQAWFDRFESGEKPEDVARQLHRRVERGEVL